ncbi:glycosyltransferase 61 family protein [Curtobacterium sp. MCSS17_016]|uniref:glycosyltransferase family 61 protein n=1 Tax=Curtobacterium sp. MCSS17_016 TaxID=2175644 RepID=UPI000DA9D9EE|nr:glycosyltransferase 61 family protein [Curtobacterium sp. MCSS17_016]WIE80439.1 glycosyltransferase 61 family protein [Curtobacterium sp. MCSS17_016]
MFGTVSNKNQRDRRRNSDKDAQLNDHIKDLQTMQRPVVLIAGEGSSGTLPRWRQAFQYRLHVISVADAADSFDGVTTVVASSNSEMADYLTTVGPVAAVIDEQAASIPEQLQRWQRLFFHVAPGGSFVTTRLPERTPWDTAVLALTSRRINPREIRELQRSAGITFQSDKYSVTVKEVEHLVKIKDDDALAFLPTRLGANNVRLLGSRPGGRSSGSLQASSHGSTSEARLPAQKMTYPELTLREFRGRTDIKDGMLAVNTSTVLPSSFKHPWRTHSTQLRNINDLIAVVRSGDAEAVHLDGTYYDLTNSAPGNEAHFFTESLPKLWGWREAKERDPSLRAFYRIPSPDWEPLIERTVLQGYGLSADDIHWEHRNVSVGTFVSASQGWQNGGSHFAHPVTRDVWRSVRSTLVRPATSTPQKLFVTRGRTAETPGPRNASEVETFFATRGFEVVDVDAVSVEERVDLFGNAAVVAGFAGGGMYNMLFAEHLEKVIVLSHESNTGRNEHLFASLLTEEIHYFWSKPDVEQPEDRFSGEAYNSEWDFDFTVNRSDLERVIS